MTLYLYSNILGSFLFNDKSTIIDEIKFKHDYMDKYRIISVGDWISEERTLLDKNRGEPVRVLNKKNEYFYDTSGVDLDTEDSKIIEKIYAIFSTKNNFSDIRKRNIKITRKDMSTISVSDVFVIQTVQNMDEIEHSTNTLSKRLREWYELYAPEISRAIPDHKKFSELILKQSKTDLMKELKIRDSMGVPISDKDLKPILKLAEQIVSLFTLKEEHLSYLETLLNNLCPNVKSIVGTSIAGRLIALARSLERLSSLPSSTVQTLGAEKAMFRHLKSGSRPPKYGVILMHPLVANAGNNKGKVARMLANKVSLAAKVDFFKGKSDQGSKLKIQLEADIKKIKDKLKKVRSDSYNKKSKQEYKSKNYSNESKSKNFNHDKNIFNKSKHEKLSFDKSKDNKKNNQKYEKSMYDKPKNRKQRYGKPDKSIYAKKSKPRLSHDDEKKDSDKKIKKPKENIIQSSYKEFKKTFIPKKRKKKNYDKVFRKSPKKGPKKIHHYKPKKKH